MHYNNIIKENNGQKDKLAKKTNTIKVNIKISDCKT